MTRHLWDIVVTVTLWVEYIMGYVIFFSPFYLSAFFFSPRPDETFQRWNQRLHRLFFRLVRLLIPGVKWRIADDVRAIRSSIIVANHLSFLDPILFVALYEKQKTIVKRDYFRMPVFGWILRTSGYMPSVTDGFFTQEMMQQIKDMKSYLAGGGNFFVFPEGTRSRDGRLGTFDKGAFRIAKRCRAPIRVVRIRNTDKLYPPDGWLFRTGAAATIEMELLGSLTPDYDGPAFTLSGLMAETCNLLKRGKGNR